MRQLICRRTCEWLEIGYTYRAVRISYLVRLAEVAHIHIGYCKITTCNRARPDKRAQRCSVSSSYSFPGVQEVLSTVRQVYVRKLVIKKQKCSDITARNIIIMDKSKTTATEPNTATPETTLNSMPTEV